MNTTTKEKIQNDVYNLTDRLSKEPLGIDGEVVKINLDITLRGLEAVDYQLAKIFSQDTSLSHKELVEYIFRIGLRETIRTVGALAVREGIQV